LGTFDGEPQISDSRFDLKEPLVINWRPETSNVRKLYCIQNVPWDAEIQFPGDATPNCLSILLNESLHGVEFYVHDPGHESRGFFIINGKIVVQRLMICQAQFVARQIEFIVNTFSQQGMTMVERVDTCSVVTEQDVSMLYSLLDGRHVQSVRIANWIRSLAARLKAQLQLQ